MNTLETANDPAFSPMSAEAGSFEYEGSDLEAMKAAENYPNWIKEEFYPYLRGNVADIGAGTGNFAKYLLDSDLQSLHAFEPSTHMHAKLKNRFPGDERFKTVNAYVTDVADEYAGSFDTVIYNNVMEHIEDDEAELKAVYRMLRPGGKVLVFVPALSWLYSDFDRSLGHFRRYHKTGGSQLMVKAGFTVKVAKYVDALGVLPWFLCMKVFKGRLSTKNVSLYDRIGVPITKAIEKTLKIPAGKNLLLVGSKDWLN